MESPDTAIVIINSLGRTGSPELRRWLAKGSVSRLDAPSGLAARLLDALGIPGGVDSPAARRYLGQTGDHVEGWIAAADPVYLEPRLDHLCLHTLAGKMRDGELKRLVEHLNGCLGDAAEFLAIEQCGYLKTNAMPVAEHDPDTLHGYVPNKFLPTGAGADAFRRLQSEIEMALHDHPVNTTRQADGLQPVNSFWMWGGGETPKPEQTTLPPLFADDPLIRGLWSASGAGTEPWSQSLAPAFEQGGVVVVPEDDTLSPEARVESVRAAFDSGSRKKLKLLTRDGVSLAISRADRWKFWRGEYNFERSDA